MLGNQNATERGLSRPIVLGFVLLLLFYSTTQDWSSVGGNSTHDVRRKGAAAVAEVTTKTREQMIRELVKTNEALEKENADLRLEIVNLKSALKEHDSTSESSSSVNSLGSTPGESNEPHLTYDDISPDSKTFTNTRRNLKVTYR